MRILDILNIGKADYDVFVIGRADLIGPKAIVSRRRK